MKIAILGTRGFPDIQGGVEKHCEGLAVNLVKLGCEVIVFTRKPYIKSSVRIYKGVKLVPLAAVKNKTLEAFLHTFLGVVVSVKYRPDIIHFQAIGPAFFSLMARIMGMKVIMTSHGPNYRHLKWNNAEKKILRIFEFMGVSFSHKIIAISNPIAEDIKRQYKKKPVVIPNGVTAPVRRELSYQKRQNGLEKNKYILAVGRLVPEKGFHILIEAFHISKMESWKLIIVGKADHESEYSRALLKSAKKNRNIILTGYLSEQPLQELYSNAGLFVMPSFFEAQPIALIEALSYGISCLASDIVSHREFQLQEKRYFKVGDIKDLSEKIKVLSSLQISEREKYQQQSIVLDKYKWDNVALQTLELYKQIV